MPGQLDRHVVQPVRMERLQDVTEVFVQLTALDNVYLIIKMYGTPTYGGSGTGKGVERPAA